MAMGVTAVAITAVGATTEDTEASTVVEYTEVVTAVAHIVAAPHSEAAPIEAGGALADVGAAAGVQIFNSSTTSCC